MGSPYSQILVIDDDISDRNKTVSNIKHRFETEYFKPKVEAIEIDPNYPAERLADKLICTWKPHTQIVILDLCLGKRFDDGLQAIRYVRHFFTGAIILHSSLVTERAIIMDAARLGIRMGVTKHSDELYPLIEAAERLALVKYATLGCAMHFERIPVPDFEPPFGKPSLTKLLTMIKDLGRRFDGTSGSVNWKQAEKIKTLIREYVKLSEQNAWMGHYKDHEELSRANFKVYSDAETEGKKVELSMTPESPYFFEEWITNTIPFLMSLPERLRENIAKIKPHLNLR